MWRDVDDKITGLMPSHEKGYHWFGRIDAGNVKHLPLSSKIAPCSQRTVPRGKKGALKIGVHAHSLRRKVC